LAAASSAGRPTARARALFTHVAGIKTVMPNPHDAKGLLIAAIEDNDPVIFFEPKRIYNGPSTAITTSRWSRGAAIRQRGARGYYSCRSARRAWCAPARR
jgi:pyruvate/2-oxoglutarate/acetoin dehydrogenase E1 component